MRGARSGLVVLLACVAPGVVWSAGTPADAAECNKPALDAVTWVDLPGKLPFQALPSRDGCWVFVSLAVGDSEAADSDPDAQVAVFERKAGRISRVRSVQVGGNPTGMALTHDEQVLVVADGRRVVFLDTQRLVTGDDHPVLGYWSDGTPEPGRIYVNITSDDKHLFISDENARAVTVLDLAKARASHFTAEAKIGRIPVGLGPVALTFSADERYLYSTSLGMPVTADWPAECVREWIKDPASQRVPQGAIFVVDVARARVEPANSVVSVVKAGCTPVRLVTSPPGSVAYVSARGGNALLAFDTAKLVTDPGHALIGTVPTGPAPIGVAVIDDGRKVVVTQSNRFGATPTEIQSLLILDAAKVSAGKDAIVGTVPAGALPREMRVTSDGRTLLIVNTISRKLQVIDVARLPR